MLADLTTDSNSAEQSPIYFLLNCFTDQIRNRLDDQLLTDLTKICQSGRLTKS